MFIQSIIVGVGQFGDGRFSDKSVAYKRWQFWWERFLCTFSKIWGL